MIYDIIVIGAGPAGMTASIYAARNKANVCLLEHNDRTGRKILSTGNGKCNITNMNMSSEYYNTSSNADLSRIIDERTTMEVIDLCNNMGILPELKTVMYILIPNRPVRFWTDLIPSFQGIMYISSHRLI